MVSQHPHLHRRRMTHRRSCLVQSIVRSLPVNDPHLQKVIQDFVGHHVVIQHQQILVGSDHVHPKEIIMVKVEEVISPPPFLDHKLISVLLSSETNPVGASTEDLSNG